MSDNSAEWLKCLGFDDAQIGELSATVASIVMPLAHVAFAEVFAAVEHRLHCGEALSDAVADVRKRAQAVSGYRVVWGKTMDVKV